MTERIRELATRLEGMSVRERALVLCAALGLLLALWDAGVLRKIERHAAEVGALREQLSTQAQANAQRVAEIKAQLAQGLLRPDPGSAMRRCACRSASSTSAYSRRRRSSFLRRR